MASNETSGDLQATHHSFIKGVMIGVAFCTLLIGWSFYNKRIGEPIFQLNTNLEYVVILSPPLLMCSTVGAFLDYRKSKRKGILLLSLAGLTVSLGAFLFLAWVASLAAGSR